MIRRPPRSTLSSSSAASDVYKRQVWDWEHQEHDALRSKVASIQELETRFAAHKQASSSQPKPQSTNQPGPVLSNSRLRVGGVTLKTRLKHVTVAEIDARLCNADLDWFSAERVHGMDACCPTDRECAALRAADSNRLYPTERFMLEMTHIAQIRLATDLLLWWCYIRETVELIQTALQTAVAAADELRANREFHAMLHLVLAVGNALNDGKAQRAAGFTMDSLLKLKDMRLTRASGGGADRKTITLLDYIVLRVEAVSPELHSFGDRLKSAGLLACATEFEA
eukprot:TRINITY_DN21126_c0_g1_i4.p1 TRINITY_DN21126_c0_g1~~TRINITY_DN21126_c0_g1_i4.p1  ORF type:complete len:283 (+),score=86.55 TRINITY_DN21126_c0_g1_i4:130-978(+)